MKYESEVFLEVYESETFLVSLYRIDLENKGYFTTLSYSAFISWPLMLELFLASKRGGAKTGIKGGFNSLFEVVKLLSRISALEGRFSVQALFPAILTKKG